MGMGLAICRSIIEAHDGRLWVTANTPQGAVFQFTLNVDFTLSTVPETKRRVNPQCLGAGRALEAHGHRHQVRKRRGLHLAHDLTSVRLDGDLADAELASDLFVQQA